MRNFEHLLLKENHSVGLAQNRCEIGMIVNDRLLAATPAHEWIDHPSLQWPWSKERDLGDQIVERLRLMLREQVHLSLRLDLKDAERASAADEIECCDIVE